MESTFALILLLFLVLGTIEVAFALYGRNVVLAAAHDGARAAIELGRDPAEAAAIARSTVVRSAGGIATDLDVDVSTAGPETVAVRVRAVVDAWGPIPFPLPVDTVARASSEGPAG